MNKHIKHILFFTIFLMSPTAYAGGSGECTPVDQLPFVINLPGSYCLTSDLNASLSGGKGITIRSSDVSLDLRHFTLSNAFARKGNAAIGIYASGRSNVRISNGNISGWGTGVHLSGPMTMGNRITKINFDTIRKTGIDAEGIGLEVFRNKFTRIGESTRFSDAIGIDFNGTSPRIRYNEFRDVSASSGNGSAIGVQLMNTGNPIVEDNTYDDLEASGLGLSTGIKLDAATNAFLVKNYIQSSDEAISFRNGSSGLIKDTLTSDVDDPLTGIGFVTVGFNF